MTPTPNNAPPCPAGRARIGVREIGLLVALLGLACLCGCQERPEGGYYPLINLNYWPAL